MEKYLNMVVDSHNWVNEKLPWNCWNDCTDDSEGSLAKWTGEIFRIGAFVVVVCGVIAGVQHIMAMGGETADTMGKVSAVLGGLVWLYVAFPLGQIVLKTGNELAGSKSDTVSYLFHDLPVGIMKMARNGAVMVALFGAVIMTLNWVTTLGMADAGVLDSGWYTAGSDGYSGLVGAIYNTPMSAMSEFLGWFGMGVNDSGDNTIVMQTVAGFMNDGWGLTGGWSDTAANWSMDNLGAVAWSYVGVAVLVAQWTFVILVWQFFWGLLSTLFNFVKNPYLPFRTK
jgi:hypothetical protein